MSRTHRRTPATRTAPLRATAVVGLAAVTALLVAGCSSTESVVTPADVAFTARMVTHHEQALALSDVMLAKRDIPLQVRELADGITATQGPEVATMARWMREWGFADGRPAPGTAGVADENLAGEALEHALPVEGDVAALEAAEGEEAARLFLEKMIRHHEGAVTMAEEVLDEGANEDVRRLAESISVIQDDEIAHMEDLLRAR